MGNQQDRGIGGEAEQTHSKNKEKNWMSKLKKKFVSIPPKMEKFIVFGQDTGGKNFFLRLDSANNKLVQEKAPDNVNFFNYSGVTMIGEDRMIVCGGIQYNLTGISKECFEYSFVTEKFMKIKPMIDIRYTFPVIHYGNRVYAVGGRVYGDDTVSLLRKCEYYDLTSKTWHAMPEMNITRCTSSLFIYANQLWVIGGYSGRFQRTKKIERYIIEEERWEILDFKLFFGFENGNICATTKPNEILLLGGKMNYGSANNVWCYDILNKTIINRKPVKNECILTKHQQIDENTIMILGSEGKDSYFFEKYNVKTTAHVSGALKVKHSKLEKFKQYNFNTPSIIIKANPNAKNNFQGIDFGNKNIIFGNDQEPFQLEVDCFTKGVSIFPIPTKLKLKNFQGCCRISDHELFMCGGINVTFLKISSKSFIYNLKTREVQYVNDMNTVRYTFPLVYHKKHVYAIGGREYGDDSRSVLDKVERFSLEKMQWETIPSMNLGRCTSSSLVVDGQLYVFGGFCYDSKRTDTIEIFNEETWRWEVLGVFLPSPLEASTFIRKEEKVFFFGGRTNKGDTKNNYWFTFGKGDFDVIYAIKTKLRHMSCLQKVVYVNNSFFILGGLDYSKINIVEGESLKHLKKGEIDQSMVSQDDDFEIVGFNQIFVKNIKMALESVTFTSDFIKRNSFVLPSRLCIFEE